MVKHSELISDLLGDLFHSSNDFLFDFSNKLHYFFILFIIAPDESDVTTCGNSHFALITIDLIFD